MRYNPGGYTVTCRLLASLIVRNDCLGKTYSQSKYNADKQKTSYGILTETFDTEVAAMNIDMQRVYVLATDRTASAAENIINSLRGADMQVIHIGTRTEGKNVGMTLFEKYGLDGYDYEFWPVTFKIYNAKGESDFGDGFTPDYNIDEWSAEYYSDWKELGQSDEILTAAAISLISGEQTPANEATRSSGHLLQVAGSSDFCKIKGLRETSIANQQ